MILYQRDFWPPEGIWQWLETVLVVMTALTLTGETLECCQTSYTEAAPTTAEEVLSSKLAKW